MADALEIVMLVCLATVFCVGTTLNSLTMYILVRNKTLRKKLASVRWLMFGQSLSEALVCGIGAPVMFANTLIGMAPPFTTVPLVCHLNELVGFGSGYVALWYQTAIALTRLAAVMAPHWYRNYIKNRVASTVLFVFPWFIGYIGYAIGAWTHAYDIRPTPGTGTCAPNEYDESPEAEARFASYLLSDTFLHSWSPQLLGLLCYIIIYTRKAWLSWKRQKQVKPTATTLTGDHGLVPTMHRETLNEQESIAAAGPAHVGADQPTTLVTNNVAVLPQAAAAIKARRQRQKLEYQRDQKIKLLAIAYLVNIFLTFPDTGIVWGFNYYTDLSQNAPVFARILDVMSFIAFPINPLLYIVVSKDFRQAFREFFCRSVPQPTSNVMN